MTINETREQLYAALRALGPGWHARTDLARAIGKARLNPVEAAALDLLASEGRIEKRSQPVGLEGPGGNIHHWVYRVSSSVPAERKRK